MKYFFCSLIGVSFLSICTVKAQNITTLTPQELLQPLNIQTKTGAGTANESIKTPEVSPTQPASPPKAEDPKITSPEVKSNLILLNPNTATTNTTAEKFAEPQYSCKSYIEVSTSSKTTNDDKLNEKQEAINKKRIALLKEKLEKNKNNIIFISRLGKEYYDQKKYPEAIEHYWMYINLLNEKDLLLLARAHDFLLQKVELQKVARLIIGKNSKNSEAHFLLAKSYDANNPAELIEKKNNLTKAIELDGKNKEAILLIAQIFRSESNWFSDRNILVDGLKNLKKDQHLMQMLCESYSIDSVHDEAEKICAEAISLYPDEVRNYVYLGITYRETYKEKESTNMFDQAIKKFPKSEFAIACSAESKLKRNDYVNAFNEYQSIYDEGIRTNRIVMGYAKSAFHLKKFKEALGGFKILCQRDRSNFVEFRRSTMDLAKTSYKKEWQEYERELNNCLNR